MLHHSDFIGYIANIYKPKSYLELGLYSGETISKVIPYCNNCIGVDMNRNKKLVKLQKSNIDKLKIMYMTTDEYFELENIKFDMIFIDADHNIDSVRTDFNNSLKLLSNNGIIMLHDMDPINDSYIDPKYCGDSYKFVSELENDDRFNITTLPICEAGLSLVTYKNSTRTLIRKNN
jgi:predicted O-methyltransferase YrrM